MVIHKVPPGDLIPMALGVSKGSKAQILNKNVAALTDCMCFGICTLTNMDRVELCIMYSRAVHNVIIVANVHSLEHKTVC